MSCGLRSKSLFQVLKAINDLTNKHLAEGSVEETASLYYIVVHGFDVVSSLHLRLHSLSSQ